MLGDNIVNMDEELGIANDGAPSAVTETPNPSLEAGTAENGQPDQVEPPEPPEPTDPERDETPIEDEVKQKQKTGSQRAREKAARLESENEALRKLLLNQKPDLPQAAPPQPTEKPLPENFDSHEAWVEALKSRHDPLAERPGVLHSFSATLETARQAMHLGFYIGVTGPVTFSNARQRQEIVAALPLSRLLIETDAPFLAPQPQRGKRNEPAYVRLIADKIGLLHSCTTEAVAAATSENALRLFNWK